MKKIIVLLLFSFCLFANEIKKIKVFPTKEIKNKEIVETYLIKNLKSDEVLSALNDMYNVKLKLIENELLLQGSKENIEKMKKTII